jgi:release factor glutamine methyltransferase
LIAEGRQPLTPEQLRRFEELVRRRENGEPLAYLVGTRAFYGLELEVSEAVLIPRPETELLVDLALQRLSQHDARDVLDLGTGSGAIALAIAANRVQACVLAVDISAEALEVAARNRRHHHAGQMELNRSDWFAALGGRRFDVIVSNPPYVAQDDAHLGEGDLRFEPKLALVGGGDGLDAIRRIVRDAPGYLKQEGWLLLEHGYDQASAVRALLLAAGFGQLVQETDLAGHVRVTGGRLTA